MKNWFKTLDESLESENFQNAWPCGLDVDVSGSRTVTVFNTEGRLVKILINRDENGMYERPIWYPLLMTGDVT